MRVFVIKGAAILLLTSGVALTDGAPSLDALRAEFLASPGVASAEHLAKAFLKEKKADEGIRFFASSPSMNAMRQGASAYGRGFVRQGMRDWNGAVSDYEEALAAFQAAGDVKEEAVTLHSMGSTLYASSRYKEALAVMEHSLAAREKIRDSVGAARARMGIGAVHWALGNYAETAKMFEAALGVLEAAGERAVTAQLLNNLGGLHWTLGSYAEALDFYKRSLRLKQTAKENLDAAGTLNNIGALYSSLGDYARALAFYEDSLASAGSAVAEVTALGNIGQVYWLLGDDMKGLSFLERSLAAAREIGDRASEARALNMMGALHRGTGHYAEALECFRQSLAIRTDIGDKGGTARALVNVGAVHESMGATKKAEEAYRHGLSLLEDLGDKVGISQALVNLCKSVFGSEAEVLARGGRALALARETGAAERIHEAHMALGLAHAATGNTEAAASHLRSAIEAVESMRALLAESEHKSGFLGTKLAAYESLVELLMADTLRRISGEESPSSAAEAFCVAERMKARSFLDELGAAKFFRAGVPEELLREKRILEARLKWLRERSH